MGRYEAHDIYAEEHVEDEATRAVEPRTPTYDDQLEGPTRSARESRLELEALVLGRRSSHVASSERARQAFVAPAELEGDRSPSLRARKSFADPSELSYPEASERRARASQPPRASHVAASERRSVAPSVRPPPPPSPPRSSRASYAASSERSDFASSLPSSRPLARPPSKPSYAPPPVETLPSRPDYQAMQRFLFEDVSPESPEAVAMSNDERSVSMRTPVSPMLPPPPRSSSVPPAARASHVAFRPGSAARASHHAFRPAMSAMMGVPHAKTEIQSIASIPAVPPPQDSFVDSSWIVPTPRHAIATPPLQPSPFKITLSVVAATVTAIAALAVMIGAIVFIRTDDGHAPPPATAGFGPITMTTDFPVQAVPVANAVVTTAPIAPNGPVTEAPVAVPNANAKVDADKSAPPPKATPKKKLASKIAAAPTASDEEDEAPPPKPTKAATPATTKKTAKDKAMEQVLADLGEEQLKR